MPEYHVSFRKVLQGGAAEVLAQVSENDPELVAVVETIRARVIPEARAAHVNIDAIPNGPFMEVEFLIEPKAARGVVFMTPYLPDPFVAVLHRILADAGIDNTF